MAVQDVQLDALDAKLLAVLDAAPRIGVLELSRRLAVARGTVQARLDNVAALHIEFTQLAGWFLAWFPAIWCPERA